ncbi:MAG TPA: BamA/TamA family outer membrane protein [Pusillimonas sp.]|uniref:autotransporter assembly complex protein TamA n=1 Tax=Pusillimonas sp. TaxID=3040095 RepID=UPI002C63E944|nr:BamA/TamA family outer membrane protein [Pusillimonas sp.]HUH88105.1 BamA/TamA family outer membrane protein [Pusillimonas sp.]
MRLAIASAVLVLGLIPAALAATPEVTIDPGGVPPEALQSIMGAVDVITRLAEDQDGGEVSRLRRRARDATLSALETQGYFSAVVNLEVGSDVVGETWDITIEPGPRTDVRSVDLAFSGHIATPPFAGRVDTLKAAWPLPEGMPFVNEQWNSAKSELIDAVSRKDFYLARIRASQATILADEAQADLHVAVDSGPRVRMGELTVNGLRRVPRKLIDRYVRYTPGDPYDQDLLDEWQQALESTTFFRGAFVVLEDDPALRHTRPDGEVEIPVSVRVTEAPAKRLSGSLGLDSDHGVRIEGLYRQNVVFGQPISIETGFGVDRKRQRAFYDIYFPPSERGYQDSVGVLYNHSDIEGLDTTRYGLGWKRSQQRKAAGDSRVEFETRWGLIAAYDKTQIDGAESYKVPSLVATWQWLRRDVNDKYDPREGNLFDFGVGTGVTLDKGEPFHRASVRLQQWWPIGKRDVLTLRGEVGKVWSRTDRLPEDFGFRVGGGRTIRGYKFQSIGLPRGDATIGAPAMVVASVEYTHYFTESIGMATFVDFGDATESFGDMDLAFGYGVGARVRTPAGPFGIDVAYGQRDRRLRLHFSLGIAF